jgi:lipoprotein-anchoring transpeptidase ErfK/SrfK
LRIVRSDEGKQVKTVFKSAATALMLSGLLASHAVAQPVKPFQGVVLVAAVPQSQIQPEALAPASPFRRGKIVPYISTLSEGSVIVDTRKNLLFYVIGNGQAVQYRVATAKKGFEWRGTHKVSAKTAWPDWRPPAEMRKRRPELPGYMAGGPKNPLGARAIYLGSSIYRIHGTNEPSSIGKAASSGCIRMLNEDVSELYRFVKTGTVVTVL